LVGVMKPASRRRARGVSLFKGTPANKNIKNELTAWVRLNDFRII
jgi:hypothetical protein